MVHHLVSYFDFALAAPREMGGSCAPCGRFLRQQEAHPLLKECPLIHTASL
jgi:hypothetical protein